MQGLVETLTLPTSFTALAPSLWLMMSSEYTVPAAAGSGSLSLGLTAPHLEEQGVHHYRLRLVEVRLQ